MSIELIGKNTVIYAVGNVGMRAAAFLLIPLYTHTLSIGDYGLLATLQLTMQTMMIFMNSGMRNCLVRFTKEFKENNCYGKLLGTSSMINLLAGIMVTWVSLMFLLSFFRNILHTHNVYSYIGLACGATLAQSLALHLMACYRAEDKSLKFMVTGLLSSIILILTNGVFLHRFNLGVIGALAASVVTYGAFLLFFSWDIFSKTGIGISWQLIPRLFHYGFPLIFSELALLIMGGASVYFLSYYVGLESVAIFSLGSKLASVLLIAIILPFQLAFQPFIFLNLDRADIKETVSKLLTYLILVMTGMFFVILVGSRVLLPIIAPPEYSSSFRLILFLLPGTAFIGMYYIGETLLGAAKKTHIIGFLMALYAIVSILLNYLLIPAMNWYGAIIATNVSFVLAGLTFLMIGKKFFTFTIEWKRISVCAIIITLFFWAFFILNNVNLTIFIMVSLVAAGAGIWMLSRLQFFSTNEITMIKNLMLKF